jgi:nicotinate-nucleotide pyrophosphorylase (carboxylating)
MFDVSHAEVQSAVDRALAEDIGTGDITSELTVSAGQQARGSFIAKEDFVVAGVELLPVIYRKLGNAEVRILKSSGSQIGKNDVLANVTGSTRTLLSSERVALNFLQRLSGIATLTRQYVEAVNGRRTKVLDTRKTTPGLRLLEKFAVAAGGGTNHRRGLYDAVLIKNNHIAAVGSVRQALTQARNFAGPVEIEVRTRAELEEALECGARHLLLDNLTPEEAREWIAYIGGRATTELSGNITLQNIRSYAAAGPDFISCGSITHSATAVDIAFRLEQLST